MKGFIISVICLIGAGTLAAGADAPLSGRDASESLIDPPGRVVAARGILATLEGSLIWEDQEWHLREPGSSRMYELHMGPYGHQETALFTDGADARVEGFVLGDHIAPIAVHSEGGTREFWTASRLPRWAGAGEGEGKVAWQDEEVPRGQRLAGTDSGQQINRREGADARLLQNRRSGETRARTP